MKEKIYPGLPERWAIRANSNSREKIKEWLKRDFGDKSYQYSLGSSTALFHYPNYLTFNGYNNGYHLEGSVHLGQGYEEISYDQFLKHVIGNSKSLSQSIDNDILIHF